jgi:hypothetical protein
MRTVAASRPLAHTEVLAVHDTIRLVGDDPSRRSADETGDGGITRPGGSNDASIESGSTHAAEVGRVGADVGGAAERSPSGRGEAAAAEAYLRRRRLEREAAIDRLMLNASGRGHHADRAFWAMIYDFEHAPRTTNLAQLKAIGIDVPPSGELADDELSLQLAAIIEGLGRLGVYLTNTNHLTDRQMYERLAKDVLEEEIPDIVGDAGTAEWVDLCTIDEQERFDELHGYPPKFKREPPSRRDATLPRPASGGW